MSKGNSVTTRGSKLNKATSVVMAFVLAFGLCPTPGKAYAAPPNDLTAGSADLGMTAQAFDYNKEAPFTVYYFFGDTGVSKPEDVGQFGAMATGAGTANSDPVSFVWDGNEDDEDYESLSEDDWDEDDGDLPEHYGEWTPKIKTLQEVGFWALGKWKVGWYDMHGQAALTTGKAQADYESSDAFYQGWESVRYTVNLRALDGHSKAAEKIGEGDWGAAVATLPGTESDLGGWLTGTQAANYVGVIWYYKPSGFTWAQSASGQTLEAWKIWNPNNSTDISVDPRYQQDVLQKNGSIKSWFGTDSADKEGTDGIAAPTCIVELWPSYPVKYLDADGATVIATDHTEFVDGASTQTYKVQAQTIDTDTITDWYVSYDEGKTYTQDSVKSEAELTELTGPLYLKAYSEDVSYKVTVDSSIKDGSVTASPNEDVNKGQEVTLTFNADTGYEVDTVTVTGDETTTVYTGTDGFLVGNKFKMPAEDVTVSATFKKQKFTVSYELDGTWPDSVAAPEGEELEYGGTHTVAANLPDVEGYYHTGWNQTGTLTVTSNVTIKDTWTPITYDFVFDLGDDYDTKGNFTSGDDEKSHTLSGKALNSAISAADITTTASVTCKEGITFNGWEYTDASGGTQLLNPATLTSFLVNPTTGGLNGAGFQATGATATRTVTLRPNFTESYSIMYLKGDKGDFTEKETGKTLFEKIEKDTPLSSSYAYQGAKGGSNENGKDKSADPKGALGYTFTGWTWDGQTSPTKTLPATVDKSYVFTANWEADKYDVGLELDGGSFTSTVWGTLSGSTYKKTFEVDDAVTLPTDVTKAGYTFDGWKVTYSVSGNPALDATPTSFTMPVGDVTLQAQWTANTDTKYIVTHYQQNADDDNYVKLEITDELTGTTATEIAYGTAAAKARTFEGFTLNEDVTTAKNGTVTIGGDGKTEYGLYYNRDTYSVAYKHGTTNSAVSGIGLPAKEETVKWGASKAKPADLTAPDGWSFDGWESSPAVTVDTGGKYVMPRANVEWTATWSQNGYEVKFETLGIGKTDGTEAGGSVTAKSGKSTTANAVYGDKVNPNDYVTCDPTIDKYYFKGWYKNSDTTTLLQNSDIASAEVTENVTYKAAWGKKYQVIYKPGDHAYANWTSKGGVSFYVEPGAARPAYAGYGSEAAPQAETGYTFDKWTWTEGGNDKNSSTDTLPANVTSEVVTLDSTDQYYKLTVTANFKPRVYTVNFDVNGGGWDNDAYSVSQATKTNQGFDEAGMFNAMPTGWETNLKRAGYTRTSWNTKPDGSGEPVSNATVFKDVFGGSTDPVTIYAVWTPKIVAVNYDKNNDAAQGADPAEVTTKTGETITTAANPYALDGYTFTGWSTEKNGGTLVAESSSFTITDELGDRSPITLYAQWQENKYTIKFQNGGGMLISGETANDKQLSFAEEYTVPNCMFEKAGAEFEEWAVSGDITADAPTTVKPTDKVSKLSTVAGGVVYLTPVWADKVQVAYEANGGSWATGEEPDASYVKKGDPYTITEKVPTRNGYEFAGWYDNSSLTGTVYKSDGTKTIAAVNENTTLYAKWDPKTDTPYKVNYWFEKFEEQHTSSDATDMYSRTAYPEKTERAADTKNGTTGADITLDMAKLSVVPTGYSLNTAKYVSKKVSGEGTVEVDVYYDLTPVTITFTTEAGDTKDNPVPFTPGTITLNNQRPGSKVSVPENNRFNIEDYPGWKATAYMSDNGAANIDNNEFKVPTADVTFTAKFSRNAFSVEFKSGENGTVAASGTSTDPASDEPGLKQTVRANDYASVKGITHTPEANYVFVGWNVETKETNGDFKPVMESDNTTKKLLQDSDVANYPITVNTNFIAVFSPTYTILWAKGSFAADNAVDVKYEHLSDHASGANTNKVGEEYSYKKTAGKDNPDPATGYTFAYWEWVDKNSETLNSSKDSEKFQALMNGFVTQNLTFTAVYAPAQQKVDLDLQGGAYDSAYKGNGSETAGTWNENTTTGATVTLPNTTQAKKNGFTLSGWKVVGNDATNKGEVSTGKVFGAGGVSFTMPAGNVKLQAIWSSNDVTYTYNATTGGTVTVALPNGTASTNPQTIKADANPSEVAVATAVPNAGYDFDGWYYDSPETKVTSSTDVATAAGADLTPRTTLDASIGDGVYAYAGGTFTAKFVEKEIPVTFTADKGATVQDNRSKKEVKYGKKVGVEDFAMVKVGDAPNGYKAKVNSTSGLQVWEIIVNGTSQGETDEPSDYTITEPTTFVAKWAPKPARVTYDSNEGTGAMTDQQSETDATVTLTENTFKKTGYKFDSWNTSADGNGVTYPGTTTDENSNVTPSNVTLTYSVLSTVAPDDELKLYAQWVEDDYEIVYHSNDVDFDGSAMSSVTGDSATITESAQFNSTYTVKANTFGSPTVVGANGNPKVYTFAGWSTMRNGEDSEATPYAKDDTFTVPAGTTSLYAQWVEDTVTVTFMPGEHGTGTMSSQTIASDTTAANPATLNDCTFVPDDEANWRFGGWAESEKDAEDGKVAYSDKAPYWYAKGDTTLWAVWVTTSEYKVTYYDDASPANYLGPEGSFADRMVRYDYIDPDNSLNIKVNDGNRAEIYDDNAHPEAYYEFLGWSVSPGSGTVITDTNTYKDILAQQFGEGYGPSSQNRTVRLYQNYRVKAYDIKFDPNLSSLTAMGITSPSWGEPNNMDDITGVVKGVTIAEQSGNYVLSKPETTFQIKGLKFLGWSYDEGATVPDDDLTTDDNDKVVIADDLELADDETEVTLYAVWEPAVYSVVYNNYDTSTEESSVYDDTSAAGIGWYDTVPTPKAGYKNALNENASNALELFGGWYSEEQGKGIAFDIDAPPTYGELADAIYDADNSKDANPDSINLYVNWVSNGGKIVYNPNYDYYSLTPDASSVTPTDTVFTQGAESVKLSTGASLKVAGYKLTGWNTKLEGDGDSYDLGGTMSNPPDGTTELFAQWKKRGDYNLNFDANGGEYADGSLIATDETVQWDQKNLKPAEAPTRAGYTLSDWYFVANPTASDSPLTNADKYSDVVAKGNNPFNEDEQTVYAAWSKRKDYEVEYLNQDDSEAAEKATNLSWDSPVAAASAAEKTGYVFDGWYTEKDGEGAKVDGTTDYGTLAVTDHTPLKVYAYYTSEKVTITFTLLDGDELAGTVEGVNGDTWVIPGSITSKSYETDATSGPSILAKATANAGYKLDGWYEVEYDAASSTYKFKGSKLVEDGTIEFIPSKDDPLTGGTYAPKFVARDDISYKIEYYQEKLDTADGKYALHETEDKTGTVDATVTAPPKTYTGFEQNDSAEGTLLSSTLAGDGSTVLKVFFDRKSWPVTYTYSGTVPTGAKAAPAQTTVKYRANVTVAGKPDAHEKGDVVNGYEFQGWTNDVGGSVAEDSASFAMPAKAVTITGTWALKSYKVEFKADKNGTIEGAKTTQTVNHGEFAKEKDGAETYVVAKPKEDSYYLSGWTYTVDGKDMGSTDDPFKVAITGDTVFTAHFNEPFVVSYQPGDETKGAFKGNVEGETLFKGLPQTGSYVSTRAPYQGEVDLEGANKDKPAAKAGWKFAGWTWTMDDNGAAATYSTNPAYASSDSTVTVYTEAQRNAMSITQNITFVAEWEPTEQLVRYHQASRDDAPIVGTWGNVGADYTADTRDADDIVYYAAHKTTDTKVARDDTTNPRVAIDLGGDDLKKSGYTLVQWIDEEGNYYNTGDKVDMPGTNLDLYPVWRANAYTLKYEVKDKKGGTVSNTEDTNVPAVEPDVSNPTAKGSTAKADLGYKFVQWLLKGETYSSSETILPYGTSSNPLTPAEGETEVVFQAQFTPDKFTVDVESDEGGTVVQSVRVPDTDYGTEVGESVWKTRVHEYANAGYEAGKTNKAWRYVMNKVVGVNESDGSWKVEEVVGYTNTPWTVEILGNTTFYAQWELQSAYEVKYFDGTDELTGKARTGLKWNDVIGDETHQKKGYTFEGWYKEAALTNAVAADAAVSDVATSANPSTVNPLQLYAKMTANSDYVVSYESNGGSPVADKTGQTWASKGYNENTTWAGRTFDGWFVDQDLSGKNLSTVKGDGTNANDVTFGDLVEAIDGENATTNRTKVTLYAKWTDKNYKVKYVTDTNNKFADLENVRWEDQDLAKGKTPVATADDNRFEGWYTLPHGEGVEITPATKYCDVAENDSQDFITLYAHYIAVIPYTVRYMIPQEDGTYVSVMSNEDNETYGLKAQALSAEENETVVAVPPVIAGYEVDPAPAEGSNVTVSKAVTTTSYGTETELVIYYMQKSNFSVTYNPAPDDEYAQGAEEYALTYASDSEAYRAAYDELGKDTAGNVKWLQRNFAFDDQGELVQAPERPGYEFQGWVVGSDGTDLVTVENDQFEKLAGGKEPASRTVALYAKWAEKPVTITYKTDLPEAGSVKSADADDEDAAESVEETFGTATGKQMDGQTHEYVAGKDEPIGATVVMDDDQKAKYVFLGWTVDHNVYGQQSDSTIETESVKPARGLVDDSKQGLYEATIYTANFASRAELLYDKNAPDGATIAGDDPQGPADGYVGFEATVQASPYQSTTHEFTGWNTQADGKGDSYQPDDLITLTAEPITLFAQWQVVYVPEPQPVPTTVTVVPATGGAVSVNGPNPIPVNVNDKVPAAKISAVADEGYELKGFDVTDQKGKTTRVAANKLGDYVVTGPTTVTPVFELAEFDDSDWKRLGGETAYETMQEIADEAFPNGSDYAIVATFNGYWDALTASGLAGFLECPILLTSPDELSAQTREELVKLGTKHVVIVGLQAAVSAEAEAQIRAMPTISDVVRAGGQNASGTACAIYRYAKAQGYTWQDEVLVATADGFWDALAASPYSYKKHVPILLAQSAPLRADKSFPNAQGLDAEVVSLISSENFGMVSFLGGPAAVSASAESQVYGRTSQRLAGANAVETSKVVASYAVTKGMAADHMGVATTEGYWDALTGAPLCGNMNAPLILCDPNNAQAGTSGFVENYKDNIGTGYIFGGPAALPPGVYDAFSNATK